MDYKYSVYRSYIGSVWRTLFKMWSAVAAVWKLSLPIWGQKTSNFNILCKRIRILPRSLHTSSIFYKNWTSFSWSKTYSPRWAWNCSININVSKVQCAFLVIFLQELALQLHSVEMKFTIELLQHLNCTTTKDNSLYSQKTTVVEALGLALIKPNQYLGIFWTIQANRLTNTQKAEVYIWSINLSVAMATWSRKHFVILHLLHRYSFTYNQRPSVKSIGMAYLSKNKIFRCRLPFSFVPIVYMTKKDKES